MAKAEAKPQDVTEDDRLFWSYVVEEERPTILYHLEDGQEEEEQQASNAPHDSDGEGEESMDIDDM